MVRCCIPRDRVRHWRGVAARGHAQCEHQRAQMGLRDSEPQAMLVDEPCEAACSAEALAAVFTCAELQSLLDLHMPPPDVEVVEDALALRYESFVHSLPPTSGLPSPSIGQVVCCFARSDVVYRETTKRGRPAGW